ncbi:phosphate ABC transporter permease PstA [Serpentinicella alkaliphila]|uniref:Phosphate transport system permease protein PstA n=1 Tax=Serpentinicella alkaliphila TaxID=1734049 RepID=A0A4R2TQR4_9FIRM|nr:phosphate ABC transporter permease PstA [Serpentinicella alkaliphila]QUH27089.1 phosphate ABC transporter permease PstA [Serpentinicella alkaliphila]TCQ05216.1 phosphate ABC transporter membrane protein 2 (PhoT family) [Serpentinicella alkaliphila]
MSNRRRVFDYIQQYFALGSSLITVAGCIGIIVFLFINGYSVINLQFLTTDPGATAVDISKAGGILTPIVGTFIITILRIIIALPWALSTAIYLSEYAMDNLVNNFFRTSIDILAGIPTIVIAIFGVAIFTRPQLGFLSSMVEGVEGVTRAFGKSFLVCSFAMAIMILPFVIKTCEEAIKSVPKSYREASLALGVSKWDTIVNVVLPSASNGIVTSVILGMGRMIGDTAIVWLLLGGTLRMTGNQPWYQPQNWMSTLKNTGSTLTTYIYYNSPAGEGDMPELAFGASVVLITIIIILNAITIFVGSRNKSVMEE